MRIRIAESYQKSWLKVQIVCHGDKAVVHRETKNVLGIKFNSCELNSFHVMLALL